PAPPPQVHDPLSTKEEQDLVKDRKGGVRLCCAREYRLRPARSPAERGGSVLHTSKPALGNIGTDPSDLNQDRTRIIGAINDFLNATDGAIDITGLASFEAAATFPKDSEFPQKRGETLELLIKRMPNGATRPINPRGYGHDADKEDPEEDGDRRFRAAIATAAPKPLDKNRTATAGVR